MSIIDQINKIIDSLTELKGYCAATEDLKNQGMQIKEIEKIDFTNEFLKRRFKNRPEELKIYLKMNPSKAYLFNNIDGKK